MNAKDFCELEFPGTGGSPRVIDLVFKFILGSSGISRLHIGQSQH